MSFSGFILKCAGWSVRVTAPDYPKCIICVAPHTSNWDFFLGMLAYASVGRKAGFLMKKSWFFWPLGPILRALGGIPVNRGRSTSLVDTIAARFDSVDRMTIAITPEGTRKKTTQWHTGFLRIAALAHVPVILGAIDAATKSIVVEKTFTPTGSLEEDMRAVKDYYSAFTGIHPDKFSAD